MWLDRVSVSCFPFQLERFTWLSTGSQKVGSPVCRFLKVGHAKRRQIIYKYIDWYLYIYICVYLHKYIHTYIQTYLHTYIHTYRQTDRKTDRQTDGRTDRHTYILLLCIFIPFYFVRNRYIININTCKYHVKPPQVVQNTQKNSWILCSLILRSDLIVAISTLLSVRGNCQDRVLPTTNNELKPPGRPPLSWPDNIINQ